MHVAAIPTVPMLSYHLSPAGLNFASGGADKTVIIWTREFEGVLKFSLNDTVQCLAYNPVSKQVLCCSATEVGECTCIPSPSGELLASEVCVH